MHTFRILPLPPEITAHVRRHHVSPQYGHPAHREVAPGTGPCRACLSPFVVGADERLLFTYDPFESVGDRPLPGPIAVHAGDCAPAAGEGFPDSLRAIPLTAEAYRTDGARSARIPLPQGSEAEVLRTLFDDEAVAYLHLRHATAGCYVARADRSSQGA